MLLDLARGGRRTAGLKAQRSTSGASAASDVGGVGSSKMAPAGQPSAPQLRMPFMGGVHAIASVGGRVIGGAPLHLARIAGRDADVLLPATGRDATASFTSYLDALERSGVFAAQQSDVAAIKALEVGNGAVSDDGRPRVGIVLSEALMLLPGAHANTENIIALVTAMGCRAVLIPPCADFAVLGGPQARARAVASLASSLDGLVGPGGADVDPSIYGEANTASLNTNVTRDTFEAGFVKAALDCELFAFGICRSHQLWNAAAGGSLIQDLQQEGFASTSHVQAQHGIANAAPMVVRDEDGKIRFEDIMRVAPDSRLAALLGCQEIAVNSMHHQAVDHAGQGFRVVGRVLQETSKQTIEATERWNAFTVQYHPELMVDDPAQQALFSTLGRRAHAFELLKNLRKHGPVTLPLLLQAMRVQGGFEASDLDWAKQDLAKRLR